jgi:hypothetical protein
MITVNLLRVSIAFFSAHDNSTGRFHTALFYRQGHCIYFSEAEICQNLEEFLTTKAHKGAEGRNEPPQGKPCGILGVALL